MFRGHFSRLPYSRAHDMGFFQALVVLYSKKVAIKVPWVLQTLRVFFAGRVFTVVEWTLHMFTRAIFYTKRVSWKLMVERWVGLRRAFVKKYCDFVGGVRK